MRLNKIFVRKIVEFEAGNFDDGNEAQVDWNWSFVHDILKIGYGGYYTFHTKNHLVN